LHNETKEDDIGEACNTHGRKEISIKIPLEKLEGKKLEILRRRFEYNINKCLKKKDGRFHLAPVLVNTGINPQARGPPLVGCPRLLIQYIRSYSPYLEAVSFIRNLRKRHAVVIMDLSDM
jgi:hypothetical protein